MEPRSSSNKKALPSRQDRCVHRYTTHINSGVARYMCMEAARNQVCTRHCKIHKENIAAVGELCGKYSGVVKILVLVVETKILVVETKLL